MHDVFISHSVKDNEICNLIYSYLGNHGIKCFMDFHDLIPGQPYHLQLTDAIKASKVIVLVFSSSSDCSLPVQNEISISSNNKIPIIPVRIEDFSPNGLALFINTIQWLDMFHAPLEKHLPKLVQAIKKQLNVNSEIIQPLENPTNNDQDWHDIEYKDLNAWTKDNLRILDAGKILTGKTYTYRRNTLTGKIQQRLTPPLKEVYIGDYLFDYWWHPINYQNLKDWVKEEKSKLESGQELQGHTFRYRKNLQTNTYEIRLSKKYKPGSRKYTREPT